MNACRRAAVCIAAMFVTLTLFAVPAAAHVERTIGKYHVEIGWGEEPTYTGLKNSVFIGIRDAKDKPVTDLGDTLKVEVISGTAKQTFAVVPNFEEEEGQPGDYRAWLIPTAPGNYTFHFIGTIKGQIVDLSMTAGEATFDPVQDPQSVEFPDKVPPASQISARIEREVPRLGQASQNAKDDASRAKTFAIIGLALGAIGTVLGALALAKRRG
ncbi:MAG: hypothetical protein ABR548_05000 [Actinomycetota bacterium]|nr:hypothetical protein [Actinomycetota bacterium]